MKILLHVGMPKCGSSALQACWSSRAFHEEGKARRIGYVALHESGKVWAGDELIARAAVGTTGYLSSNKGRQLTGFNFLQRGSIKKRLLELSRDYDTLILSNESWGPYVAEWSEDCLWASKDFEVSVLAYVRPQVEWMNSGWWQWGAWTDLPLPQWVHRNLPKVKWHALLHQWRSKPWVQQLDVRLLQGDVVQDFMNLVGVDLPTQPKTNQSLPASVLRLFQHHRTLRPGPHDSGIEFILSRHLKLEGGKTPWVMRPELVEWLLAACAEDNRQLMALLPPDQRAVMAGDWRWWSPEGYAERDLRPPKTKQLHPADLEDLAVAAIEAVCRLDQQLRQLQHSGAKT